MPDEPPVERPRAKIEAVARSEALKLELRPDSREAIAQQASSSSVLDGEKFATLDPKEQALVLQEMGREYLPGGYRVELKQTAGTDEEGEDTRFHEHFIYKENTRESLPGSFLEADLKIHWSRLLESLSMEDTGELDAAVRGFLKDIYQEIQDNKDLDPSEDWIDSFRLPILGMARLYSDPDARRPHLERHFNEFLRQGVEKRALAMRSQFKIHLNPHASAKLETVELLMKLISEDEYLKTHLREFKVSCRREQKAERGPSEAQRAPEIVIYPDKADSAEESMNIVAECVRRLREACAPLEDKALPIVTHVPRHNFPISRMIHVAQSEGSLKDTLMWSKDFSSMEKAEDGYWCPKEGRAIQDTMISGFFDPAGNHAFFHEDAAQAESIFAGFQTGEAASYIAQTKAQWQVELARAAALREEHRKKSVPQKRGLLQRLKDFLS